MYSTDLLVNSPRVAGAYRCNKCDLTFNAPHLLSKHKSKFCTGGTGDPDVLRLRHGLLSAEDSPRRLSPDYDRPITDSILLTNKVNQLRDLKKKRQREKDLNDLEERMLLDELQDTEAELEGSPRRPSRNRLPLSKHGDIRELQIEYEKLRELENKTAPVYPLSSRTERISPYSRNSNSSMSIHFDDDYRKYNPNQDQQLRNLAERHGQQMEHLNSRNKDLEKQRDEIRKQLEALGKKPQKSGRDSTAELLRELQRQEEANRRMLEDLRAQLYGMGNQGVKVIEVEKPVYQQPPPVQPPPPPPPPPPEPKKMMIPVYYGGGSLVEEIIAIREAYIQNGGNDQILISQLRQMEQDARDLEEEMKRRREEKPKEKPKDNLQQFKWFEEQNEQLRRELMLLQEQNALSARDRDKSDKEDELERQLHQLKKDHLQKMYDLQREMDELKLQLLMAQNRPQPQNTSPTIIQGPQPPVSLKPYVEVAEMTPYDQYAGFVIFYDFILCLDPTVQACRLVVGLHSSSAVVGEPTVLPTVYCEPASRGPRYNYNFANAVIGCKQPVPKCAPDPDLGIVAELQASGGPASEHDRHSLITRAWCKIPLFDNHGALIAGRFRIPMRNVPIKPFLHVSQCQRIPKFGDAELYYRIVNMREAEIQSMQQISTANYNQYTAPQWHIASPELPPIVSQHNIAQPVRVSPRVSPVNAQKSGPIPATLEQRLPSLPTRAARSHSPQRVLGLQDLRLGFQVDRVKLAEQGEGKVRLTAYYASTGKVVQSATSPVTCSTTAVRSNFKYGYHVFGQQEATFEDVDFQGDMVLIARFYLKRRTQDNLDDFTMPVAGAAQEPSLYDDETCVAWAAIPLIHCTENLPIKKRRTFNPSTMAVNQGTHTIQLYQPPVPDPGSIPFDDQPYRRDWERYGRNGKASLRVYIFQGQPRPGSLTPSDMSDIDEEDTLPEFAWLPLERKTPPREPFLQGDGFDIYIDACRYLPDSVTFTKVAGRILDRRYDVYGKDINTGIKLDSDVYNPVYEEKTEFREPNIPPTATLLLKVYTIDNFYKSLLVVGHAMLNIFVESGTERQPVVDKPMQVSLNEGAHQLRLYGQGPNGVDPLSEGCLRSSGVRIIPCASILVRITKIPRGSGGKALESSKIPQSDWLRMGLWQPRPKYTDRVYYSSKCMPTKGETRLFHSMMRRTRRSVREVIALVAQAKESFLRSDKNMEEYIRNQLTKGADQKPLDQDLNFICQYSPKNGIKVAIDSAVNLPWSNFTHAHMCLNPPAAFYLGAPHATYDKLVFTELLDLKSTNSSPQWKDGFKLEPTLKHIAVIVSPLRSLIYNQMSTLRSKGFRCASLSQLDEDSKTDVTNGNVDVLFTSPEAVLSDFGRELFTSNLYKESVCVLAFDEAHCIVEWGDDFRPIYGDVSIIRSWLSEAPVLLLSATITKAIFDKILTTLMLPHHEVITMAKLPDRPNLFLTVKKAKDFKTEIQWLVNELMEKGRAANKTIIYCRSMVDAANIYSFIMGSLGDSAWLTDIRDPCKRLVDVYHRSSPKSDQERVTGEFPREDSLIRCVVATIAFGLGVDIPDVRHIIHWGCSKSLLQYWQEIGRCSRDGEYGSCFMYLKPGSLDARRVDAAMLEACRSTLCLRVAVLEHLYVPGMDRSALDAFKLRSPCKSDCERCTCKLCTCCSRCKATCSCGSREEASVV